MECEHDLTYSWIDDGMIYEACSICHKVRCRTFEEVAADFRDGHTDRCQSGYIMIRDGHVIGRIKQLPVPDSLAPGTYAAVDNDGRIWKTVGEDGDRSWEEVPARHE